MLQKEECIQQLANTSVLYAILFFICGGVVNAEAEVSCEVV